VFKVSIRIGSIPSMRRSWQLSTISDSAPPAALSKSLAERREPSGLCAERRTFPFLGMWSLWWMYSKDQICSEVKFVLRGDHRADTDGTGDRLETTKRI